MIYHTVRITRRTFAFVIKWEITFEKDSKLMRMERECIKTIPNSMGFYHYPATMPDREAAAELIDSMLNSHQQEIKNLELSRESLIELKNEAKTINY